MFLMCKCVINPCCAEFVLTHWGRVMHICIGKLIIIGSDNGLAPSRRQAIIWTNDEILLITPLGTNFSGILIGNQTSSFMKMHLKMSSAKWRPFWLESYLVEDKDLSITHSQYHDCWCPGYISSQGISSHGNDQAKLEYHGVSSRRVYAKIWCVFEVDLNKQLNK